MSQSSLELNLLQRFNVADALHRSALRYPGRTAITFEGTNVSYRDLDGWANQVARYLIDRGVGPGDVIAALSLNHPRLVALWMGTARIGAIYCPINPMLPPHEIAATLKRVRAQGFFCRRCPVACRGANGIAGTASHRDRIAPAGMAKLGRHNRSSARSLCGIRGVE